MAFRNLRASLLHKDCRTLQGLGPCRWGDHPNMQRLQNKYNRTTGSLSHMPCYVAGLFSFSLRQMRTTSVHNMFHTSLLAKRLVLFFLLLPNDTAGTGLRSRASPECSCQMPRGWPVVPHYQSPHPTGLHPSQDFCTLQQHRFVYSITQPFE